MRVINSITLGSNLYSHRSHIRYLLLSIIYHIHYDQ